MFSALDASVAGDIEQAFAAAGALDLVSTAENEELKRSWAEKHPNTHLAMLKALIRAGKWLDENNGANRKEAAQILSRPEYVSEAQGPNAITKLLRGSRSRGWPTEPTLMIAFSSVNSNL